MTRGRQGSMDRIIVRSWKNGTYISLRFFGLRFRASWGKFFRNSVYLGRA